MKFLIVFFRTLFGILLPKNRFGDKIYSFINFVDNKENFFLSKKINLGLDLQGGSYLLLEVDSKPIVNQYLQQKLIELRKSLKSSKIKYQNLNLKNQSINFMINDNDVEKFEEFFLNKDKDVII